MGVILRGIDTAPKPIPEDWSAVRRFKSITREVLPGQDFCDTLRERWANSPRTLTEGDWLDMVTLRPMERPKSDSGAALVDVPADVAKDLEEFYAYLTENPTQIGQAEFKDANELNTWFRQAKSWGATRAGGELEVRKLGFRNLPDTEARFTIRPPASEDEIAARRAAREKAKAAKQKKEAKAAAK